MSGARLPHRCMKGGSVGIVLRTPPLEHRRQVGSSAKPAPRSYDEAGIEMPRRHMRVPRMGYERHTRSPEAWISFGIGNLAAELGGELTINRRSVDSRLFEQPAAHESHDAAAA